MLEYRQRQTRKGRRPQAGELAMGEGTLLEARYRMEPLFPESAEPGPWRVFEPDSESGLDLETQYARDQDEAQRILERLYRDLWDSKRSGGHTASLGLFDRFEFVSCDCPPGTKHCHAQIMLKILHDRVIELAAELRLRASDATQTEDENG
jgi:hypothetical protein